VDECEPLARMTCRTVCSKCTCNDKTKMRMILIQEWRAPCCTGQANNIVISNDKGRMNQEEVERLVEEAKIYAEVGRCRLTLSNPS